MTTLGAAVDSDEERDEAGRHPGAPAWNGNLETLSPAGLEQHDKGLVTHIGNLTVLYGVLTEPAWRVRTPEERRADRFEQWVERLAVVRNERSRREGQVGGLDVYLKLFSTPAWNQPWTGKP
ncbi:hypothetical protein ACIQTZ_11955 [Paenarthrobacter sp. NPDC090520]|uniref:hypothetical protein n=1 Tax=Paenarthrobacter sp. NPDC090520 TaxID=3364382 RepID=UPI003826EFBA